MLIRCSKSATSHRNFDRAVFIQQISSVIVYKYVVLIKALRKIFLDGKNGFIISNYFRRITDCGGGGGHFTFFKYNIGMM